MDTETDGTETDGELTETAGIEEDESSEKTVKAIRELSGMIIFLICNILFISNIVLWVFK